ncbi:Cell surface glycan-binding lipoprotein, utilization system for glycans and polysaccharides (PUL), SusD family [Bacteroides ovatus]|uniref:RagB/SusD family nutrient uptake outer membrane protein n=1 Tax=Bacteroides ovatus TaxID=28116 RepID=UPI0020A7B302|nr:RagB/SusD family nutrient uptake outer membrane protein [Bacteroides ovatus]MCZ2716075.1 RagB/SusD family nutrient uptake outer membrane protein [Bacteroides ovatus]CAG9890644.1 Cell surface glycan-binding lipoprotein, utilization system for glycans and polysaccharides (PUL), SusD family [Bacteroides ovatus]
MKKILTIFVAALLLTGCDDLFTPAIENNKSVTDAHNDPLYAEGILANAYTRNPYNSQSFNDVATDDAVSNKSDEGFLKMATGSWTANNNPMDQWGSCKAAIHYINLFLNEADKVTWSKNPVVNAMFNDRLKGEAYGLRAMFSFYLLQAHAGWTADGRLLGVPIIEEVETETSNFNKPRNTFDECVQAIYRDVQKASELLPLDFEDITSDDEVPEKYRSQGVDKSLYNMVFGQLFRSRMSERVAKAFRAKTALMAASPAFDEGSDVTWEDAANYNAELLDLIGGVAGLDEDGHTWYKNADEIKNLGAGVNPQEMLWRSGIDVTGFGLEQAQFPPSLFGSGSINPTQNLVDAFPMLDGYPISESGNYNDKFPYKDRDPRLNLYIVVNGSVMGLNNKVIDTSLDNRTDNDGLNKENGHSTRTGYYLRKHLREDVHLSSTIQNGQPHYSPRIRYTEIFLNYAEAANEAWGPTGKGTHSYSAYDVIKAIRSRAGIGKDNGDAYLESVKNDPAKMRELIRNERRLELCFEGFRFWDLRRWELDLNEPAKGIRITDNTYHVFNVENRNYDSFMRFGPIPYSEVVKFDALEQNQGW